MIFRVPAACGIIERAQQFLLADFALDDLRQERAALSHSRHSCRCSCCHLPVHSKASSRSKPSPTPD
jgi:hypothetical protein